MINIIKDELKSILEDLEKIKETSNVDHLVQIPKSLQTIDHISI